MAKLISKNIKVGDKFRMANDVYLGNGYHKGDLVTCVQKSGSYIYVKSDNGYKINVLIQDIVQSAVSKADINANIKELEAEIASYKDKLEWMEETGNEEYDETEVKVWKTLKTLSSKSTDIEKAKVIAKLING